MNKMELKILGTGCKKCKQLEANTREAVAKLGIEANIEKVEDIQKIMEFGVMGTPALVVDGEVKISGKLAKAKEIEKYLV
jgi:small redox-active disulfide protein 2